MNNTDLSIRHWWPQKSTMSSGIFLFKGVSQSCCMPARQLWQQHQGWDTWGMLPLPSRHIQPPVWSKSLFSLWQFFHITSRSPYKHPDTKTVWLTQTYCCIYRVKYTTLEYGDLLWCFWSGASSCKCIGKNRAFQHSDGSCVCKAGYVFYNELDFKSSSGDSDLDCQPEVGELSHSLTHAEISDCKCCLDSVHLIHMAYPACIVMSQINFNKKKPI